MVEVTEWFEPLVIPDHGVPVLAEYYPFNTRSNALAQHVVWFWEGEYRLYPQTTGTAYVERWAHLPSYQQAAKAERDRIVVWLRADQGGRGLVDYRHCWNIAAMIERGDYEALEGEQHVD